MHRRARQPSHPRAVQEVPNARRPWPTPIRANIEAEIHSTGFFRNKTKSILGASKKIVEEFPAKFRAPWTIAHAPGVARKTANVVLGNGFGIASASSWTRTCMRLSGRLDLTRNTDPKKIEQDLCASFRRRNGFSSRINSSGMAAASAGAQAALHRMQPRANLLLRR